MNSSELRKPAPILVRKISKAQIQNASPEDQALFLTIAHAYNEMNALLRAAFWSSDFDSQIQAQVDGQLTLTLMFFKLLAGKLCEADQLLQRAYFGSALSKTYHARLTPDGDRALEKIKQYFA